MTLYDRFLRDATPCARPLSRLRIALYLFGALLLMPTTNSSADETTFTYTVGDAHVNATVDLRQLQVSIQDLQQWVRWAADSVKTYYGHYPVPNLRLRIIPTSGRGVRGGTTFPVSDGGFIRIHVGSDTIMAGLAQDWMLTHEMVHLSFPSVAENHHWIEEGIATYVEPIARVRAGHMDAREMWFEVVRDLHQGLPQTGDEGLDHTHTWGRTYWGGALFCFLADVEIHKQTNNAKGLDDALRGILNAGGDIRKDWELTDALRIGDQAVGVSVLVPLYDKMKDKPYDVDLPALWKDLGLERDGDTVRFVDSAPLAKTRDAITYGANRTAAVPAPQKQ
jgi:hypothetical protein